MLEEPHALLHSDATDHDLHVDTVAAVHPSGDKVVRTGPSVAGIVAHPSIAAVIVGVREGGGQFDIGLEALATVCRNRPKRLIVHICRVIAPV